MDRPKRTCRSKLIKEESQPILSKTEKKQSLSYNRRCLAKLKSEEEKYAAFKLQEKERLKQYRRTLSDEKKAKAREKARLRDIERRKHLKETRANLLKKHKNISEKNLAIQREKNKLAQRKRRANMDPEKKNLERKRQLAYYYMQSKRQQKLKDVDYACKTNLTTPLQSTPDWPKSICQGQVIKEEPQPILSKKEKKQSRYISNRRWLAKLKSDEEKYASFRLQEKERLKQYRRTLSDEKRAKAREKARLRDIERRKCQAEVKENLPKNRNNNGIRGKQLGAVTMDLALKRERNRLAQRKRRANMDPGKKKREREINLAHMRSIRKQKDVDNMCKTNLAALLQIISEQPKSTCHEQIIKEEPQPIHSKEEKRRSRNRRYLAKLKSDEEKYASYKLLERERLKQYRRTLSDEKRAKAREKAKLRVIERREHQTSQRAVRERPTIKCKCDTDNAKDKKSEIEDLAKRREANRLAQQRRRANMDPEKKKLEKERNVAYARTRRQQMFEIYVDIACDTDTNVFAPATSASTMATENCRPIENKLASDQPHRMHQQQLTFIKEEPQPVLGKAEKRKLYNHRFSTKLKLDEKKYASFKLQEREKKRLYRRTLSEEKKARAKEKARLRASAYRQRQKAIREKASIKECRRPQRKKAEPLDPDIRRQQNSAASTQQPSVTSAKCMLKISSTITNGQIPSPEDQPQRMHQQQLTFIKEEPQPVLGKAEKRKLYNHRFLTKLKLDEKKYASFKLQEREKKRLYRRTLSGEKKARAKEKARLRAIAFRQRQKAIRIRENAPIKECRRPQRKKAEPLDPAIRRQKNRLAQQKRRANMDPERKMRERERNSAFARTKRHQKAMENANKTNSSTTAKRTSLGTGTKKFNSRNDSLMGIDPLSHDHTYAARKRCALSLHPA